MFEEAVMHWYTWSKKKHPASCRKLKVVWGLCTLLITWFLHPTYSRPYTEYSTLPFMCTCIRKLSSIKQFAPEATGSTYFPVVCCDLQNLCVLIRNLTWKDLKLARSGVGFPVIFWITGNGWSRPIWRLQEMVRITNRLSKCTRKHIDCIEKP